MRSVHLCTQCRHKKEHAKRIIKVPQKREGQQIADSGGGDSGIHRGEGGGGVAVHAHPLLASWAENTIMTERTQEIGHLQSMYISGA